jgi:hypothetical protein
VYVIKAANELRCGSRIERQFPHKGYEKSCGRS